MRKELDTQRTWRKVRGISNHEALKETLQIQISYCFLCGQPTVPNEGAIIPPEIENVFTGLRKSGYYRLASFRGMQAEARR